MHRLLFVAGLLLLGACPKPAPKVVTPKPIERPMPTPAQVSETEAAGQGKAGIVKVSYCVDTDGKPQDVTVEDSVDPEYDEIAVNTVKTWTFKPATRDGVPYEHCTEASIEFRP